LDLVFVSWGILKFQISNIELEDYYFQFRVKIFILHTYFKCNIGFEYIMQKLVIKKGAESRIKFGHLWVFSNEPESLPKIEAGEVVDVFDGFGVSYGCAFYNPSSLICGRLLKYDKEPDLDFFVRRIEEARDMRLKALGDIEMCRLVFSESDLLPGLVVDKYGDYFAVQILSAGMDKRKQLIAKALVSVFPNAKGIIEKNDTRLREIEGLPLDSSVLFGEIPETIQVSEQGVKLELSLSSGQKTGYFLDQRNNRRFIRDLSKGLSVLDCYTNQGGFALNAGLGGATKIAAVDCSEIALECVKRNAEINGLEIETVKADVPDFLNAEIAKGAKWDMIILDPPAFAKNRKSVPKAKAAYGKINRLAMKMLNTGGYLISSSCSHHIFEDVFAETVYREACKLGKQLKLIYRGGQAPDHPILMSLPETQYLKFFVFQVV
jgi:23S rRNA (cytosine1962-C5)-methyltransferase